jgi:NADPH-dependent 2,4-dienoyl-CoA reductase/sulfur reductase-like enzyme
MGDRVVVVGADAAGMSAASQAKRLRPDLDIVALERGHHTSYSACGIPYWVGGVVGAADDLVARTADEHRANGIDLRMRAEATALDLDRREVEVRDLEEGRTYRLGFDQLVIATGARPRRPPVPGIDSAGVFGVQTLDDGERVLDALGRDPRRAVVIGGGYIGVEMAEAMVARGLEVTLLDRISEPMATLDPDMGALVRKAMEGMGIDVRTGVRIDAVETDDDGQVRGVATDSGTVEADLVVLGTGVAPETTLAQEAGIAVGRWGGLVTDLQMRVFDHPGVWAAGDCVESIDLVSGNRVHVALGPMRTSRAACWAPTSAAATPPSRVSSGPR